MKSVADINNQTRTLLNRYREGVFARAAHHNQCMEMLKRYMRALNEANVAASEISMMDSELRERRLKTMQRRIDEIFRVEEDEVDI